MQRLFGNSADTDFLNQLHLSVEAILLEKQKESPAFFGNNEKEIFLLTSPSSRLTVKKYLLVLNKISKKLMAEHEKLSIGDFAARSVAREKLQMLNVVQDVIANIVGNQRKVAEAKKRIAVLVTVMEKSDIKTVCQRLLKLNTSNMEMFRKKVDDVKIRLEFQNVYDNSLIREPQVVARINARQNHIEIFDGVLTLLPENNIDLHHLNKEAYEIARRNK
jgi:hypothetical protein